MTAIVIVNVSQQVAPTPSVLQQTGAFISQGATNTAPGTQSLLTELSDLTPLINGALSVATAVWSANVVTITTAAPHGLTVADTLPAVIAGFTPTGYNGSFTATVTGTSTFTYPLLVNPGVTSVVGKYTLEDVGELNAMATTFFAQGNNQSVYILELGSGNAAEGVTNLTAWLIANPNTIYSFLVPRYWAAESTFQTLIQSYENPSSKLYFFVTMTLGNYTTFTALQKCVIGLIEAPAVLPSAEFSLAALFYWSLHYLPSTTNKVTPFAFKYLYGVTPYPTRGNAALLQTLKNAFVNIVGTGAEGGISNTISLWGTTMDGNDFTYWYSVDWFQITAQQALANYIINGSNNPVNPLYYDQDGIDRLEGAVASVADRGVTYGLVLGTSVQLSLDGPDLQAVFASGKYPARTIVNAVPFITYSGENPSDYKLGRYAGLSAAYVPKRGFTQIIFNLVVSQFVVNS
jgi:hypothetical protein